MKNIQISIERQKVGELFFESQKNLYGFNYTSDFQPISLIMPFKNSTYSWKEKLHPIFDMNMPEGYLFEIFKNYLNKEYGYIDDFLIFSYICSNIQSRITYKSSFEKEDFESIDIDDILLNDSPDTFSSLIKTFMTKNAISGIQPKTIALLKDKESFSTKEYIIKTWGDEYPQLALNEYFCLKAVEKAGVQIPNIILSKNCKFLLVERFNYVKHSDTFLGFEEVLVLLGKNKEEKYNGSYEQIVKTIFSVVTNKRIAMRDLFKTIVMSYLLKNGDAHLKNFGILYNNDFTDIKLSPSYDIVNTTAYFFKDRPALTMFGKKLWFGKKDLIKFACEYCFLTKKEAIDYYEECKSALIESIEDLESYIQKNEFFYDVGIKILDVWKLSLDEKSYKEIPLEIVRNWTKDKRA